MKTKFLSLVLVLLISATCTYAQEELFKILVSKGSNKVVSAGSTEQKPVLIGKKLSSTDKIIVGDNCYLGLAHKSGKTIELKKAGTYEVAKLSQEVVAQNAGVAKKYVDFVAGEMTTQDEDMAKNRHKHMSVTGSVERGTDIEKAEKGSTIILIAPKQSYALSAPVLLKWTKMEHAVSYKISLTDLGEEPVYTFDTKENFAIVDLAKLNISKEKTFLWKVEVTEFNESAKHKHHKPHSEFYVIKYVEDANAATLEKQAAEIQTELNEDTALNKIVLASFFERNNLLLDARANYEAAIRLEPEVEEYKIAYEKFLANHQLPLHK